MKPYFVKTPKFVKWLYPKRIWAFSDDNKCVYLTFDDGPIPNITPWVLTILKKFNAKATFFCIGDNINKHPNVFKSILLDGHTIGNHTHNHLKGWGTKSKDYVTNCIKFEDTLQQLKNKNATNFQLFRPPYGKITSRQAKMLQKKGYKIIMWDVLSADFDKDISKEKCYENVIKNLRPGSIVVFHDSLKSEEKLKHVLPKVLEYINNKGLLCKSIPY